MKGNYFLFVILLFVCITLSAQWNYPITKTVDSTDTYFGIVYKDPYRWLEYVKNPEVNAWFKQQANFSDSILGRLTGRDELIAEWKKLNTLQPPEYRKRRFENGRIFYKKTLPGETVGKAYYREGINGKEHLIFDPTTFIQGKTLTIEGILPSYDGKKVIISYSEKGAEVSTIMIYDVENKKFLPETIYPSWDGAISWTFDNNSFTYFYQKTGDHTSPEFELNTKTKLHTLGDDVSKDIDFFSNESYPGLNIQPNDMPYATLNKDSRDYVFGFLYNVRREYACFYAPITDLKAKKLDWKVLCTPEDKLVRNIEFIGDKAFAITYKDAHNYKLVSTSLKNPDWAHAETVMEEKDETLESFTYSKNSLYLVYSNGINSHLYKYNLKTKTATQVSLPFSGSVYIYCLETQTDNCIVFISSWNKPYWEFAYNGENETWKPSEFNKPTKYPEIYTDLIVEETEVKGHDGAMIPLSIIYRKGLKLDSSNCCLMQGYGAYGYSMTPYFDVMLNSLAVKGVVVAIPHVRGGSEKGNAWYKAGCKTTKPNTWKDFNSCAEYLIAKDYTSANKLAGTGTSAGGILISRAITERPDLYAAAICNVGCANQMRGEFSPNGQTNIPEFGTVKDSIECRALYEMDGVQHVIKGMKYPAVICVGGWNDPRVTVWEPGKFAAALQHASVSGKPVLMKVNYDNGHFTEDKNVTYSNFADQFAFVLWQCGHPDFQLK